MSTSSTLDTSQRRANSRGAVPPSPPPRVSSLVEPSSHRGIAPPAPPPRVSSLIESSPHKRTSEYYPQNSQTPLTPPPTLPPLPPLPKLGRQSNPLANMRKSQSCWPEWDGSPEGPQGGSPSAGFTHPHASYKLQATPSPRDQSSEITPAPSYYIQLKPFAERPKTTISGQIPASSPPRTSLHQSPTGIDTDDEELTIFPQQMDIPKIPMELEPRFRGYKRPNSEMYQQPHSQEHREHFPGFKPPTSRQMYLPQPAFTKPQSDSQHHRRQSELGQGGTQHDTSGSSDESSTGIGDYSDISLNPEFFKRFTNITSRLHPTGARTESSRTTVRRNPSLLEDPAAQNQHNLNPYAKPGPPDPYVGSSIVVGLTKSTFKDFIKDLSAAFVLFYNPCDPKCNWAKVNMKKVSQSCIVVFFFVTVNIHFVSRFSCVFVIVHMHVIKCFCCCVVVFVIVDMHVTTSFSCFAPCCRNSHPCCVPSLVFRS